MQTNEEEFLEWRNHDVTKEVIKALKKQRETMKEVLISDGYGNPEFVRGKATVIQEIVDLDYNQLKEILNDKQ